MAGGGTRRGLDLDGLRSDPAGRPAGMSGLGLWCRMVPLDRGILTICSPHANSLIPGGSRSGLGAVGCVLLWARVGAGAGKERIDFGVELVEPLDLALELPHPLLVRDLPLLVFCLPLLFFYPLLLLSPIELDISQLEVDDGSPVQHRQPTSPARQ